jgi:restriction system protein
VEKVEGYSEAWKRASELKQEARQTQDDSSASSSDGTPEEVIDAAIDAVESNLQSELLEQLATVDPYRFEQVVIDLLFAMGYGGSREEAAKVTRKSNDEGIDGIINEDRLGLDVIYVQAKRWQGNVGRKDIQSFVGALAGQQANKGVFITTSDFSKSALGYANTVSQKVILINGARLADLMIEHDIGVAIVRTIALKRLDLDYFEE